MSEQPEYRRVLEVLAERIRDGFYQREDGEGKLPSQREMQVEFGVGNTTLRTALAILEDRGVIVSRQGAGFFVVDPGSDVGGSGSPDRGSPKV